jgi:acyl-CoA thioesterase
MTPKEIVDQMMQTDRMSQWLGISVLAYTPGNVICQMTVRDEMVNGMKIAHGGITYSLSDSALAFAVNAHGIKSVSVETSISHLQPVQIGDQLTTSTKELSLSRKIGVYLIEIVNQHQEIVSSFKGTVYRTGKVWGTKDV